LADLHQLFSGAAHGVVALDEQLNAAEVIDAVAAHGWQTLRVPVGDKATTLAAFSEAGRFPIASTNWDSLQDWLGDLSWLGPADGWLVVLDREPDDVLRSVLDQAGQEWSDRGTPFVAIVIA
jgi:hypothetical protein